METIKLPAVSRDILGKKARFLRRQGITPTHLFGHGLESQTLQCDTASLQSTIAQAGTTRLVSLEIEGDKRPRTVFIREIQRDELTGQLLHVDFYQIKKTEKIKAEVPIILTGESPAMKMKGRSVIHGVTSLSVECLPSDLPPQIEVDLSQLTEVEQPLHVRDIALSPDVTLATDPDQLVVKVAEARVVEAEEVVAEAAAEVETVAGEKAEEEAAE
jgi:large subunit ribosomal protein L25